MDKISTDIFELDSDIKLESKNDFAKNYESWRKKEELNKLKSKYGEDALDDTSSSSEEDEDGAELTEEVEKDFFKTLSYLKKKDPKIYDNNIKFFKDNENINKSKKKKNESMFIKDYERKLILENDGVISDDETIRPRSPTYVEEQNILKENIKNALSNIDDDEEDNYLIKRDNKSQETSQEENTEYKEWLGGKSDKLTDNDIKSELKPLKDFWNDPNLDDGEKFLRDYILNKRYLDNEKADYIPSYDEIVHDSDDSLSGDEKAIEEQEEFEHKFNFRFEEPDQEFIKRYPRTIEKSLRKTDDRRKMKRAETKQRKQMEKQEKMAEIQKLKELKRKEIEEKIEKLKEITGNTDVGFLENDLEEDFDPNAYDKRMQSLFNESFYEGPEEEQKPVFPDIDEELEIENWDRWNADEHSEENALPSESHCEDDDFNMDADFDPSQLKKNEPVEGTKGRKKRRRKSKVAEALSKPKPKYDPNDKNYEKYFDEYFKLDCEDIIDDIPCRFKYREVLPNDFGLSIEEILLAKERELNRWCSLKKMVQHRPDHVEKYDQIAYSKKAKNLHLKRKILPSLFSEEADEVNVNNQPSQESNTNESLTETDITEELSKEMENTSKKKKDKGKKSLKVTSGNSNITQDGPKTTHVKRKAKVSNNESKKKRFKKDDSTPTISDARLSAYGINPKKYKNKLKYGNKNK
ncbi:protein KRI1 homolog [Rhynchophorus ferrugineus]|uniref:protein KRI1 homolog n=1 Tax=Rhynchophorus ferrugineus TaxID=354439 RepID=UPI003FCE7F72